MTASIMAQGPPCIAQGTWAAVGAHPGVGVAPLQRGHVEGKGILHPPQRARQRVQHQRGVEHEQADLVRGPEPVHGTCNGANGQCS
jgi:hypothetical protein